MFKTFNLPIDVMKLLLFTETRVVNDLSFTGWIKEMTFKGATQFFMVHNVDNWHWIVLVADTKNKYVQVFDSLSNGLSHLNIARVMLGIFGLESGERNINQN